MQISSYIVKGLSSLWFGEGAILPADDNNSSVFVNEAFEGQDAQCPQSY